MKDAIQTAIDELKAAFPPHPLDTEKTPEQWSVFYTSGKPFREEVHGKKWDELPAQLLEFHHDALAFLDPEALRAVVPAYLAAAMQRGPELGMLPTFLLDVLAPGDNSKRFLSLWEPMTPRQRQAIAQALAAWAGALEERPRLRSEVEAVQKYWRT